MSARLPGDVPLPEANDYEACIERILAIFWSCSYWVKPFFKSDHFQEVALP